MKDVEVVALKAAKRKMDDEKRKGRFLFEKEWEAAESEEEMRVAKEAMRKKRTKATKNLKAKLDEMEASFRDTVMKKAQQVRDEVLADAAWVEEELRDMAGFDRREKVTEVSKSVMKRLMSPPPPTLTFTDRERRNFNLYGCEMMEMENIGLAKEEINSAINQIGNKVANEAKEKLIGKNYTSLFFFEKTVKQETMEIVINLIMNQDEAKQKKVMEGELEAMRGDATDAAETMMREVAEKWTTEKAPSPTTTSAAAPTTIVATNDNDNDSDMGGLFD